MRILKIRAEWLERLLDVPSETPDERRRARLLNILLLGLSALSFLAILAIFVAQIMGMFTFQEAAETYVPVSIVLIGMILFYAINRYWSGQIASWLFLALLTISFFLADTPYESVWGRNMIVMAVPVITASIILPATASFVVAGFITLLISAVAVIESFELNVLGIFAYFSLALISWLSSRSLERAANDLRIINTDLDLRVSQRTTELQLANEQLQIARDEALAASRLKSELLANVSHELRTPLGAILGFSEMMRAGIYGRVEERQRDTLNKIIETNKSLTDLVSELLDEAQLEAGQLKLQNEPFNPKELARSVKDGLEALTHEKELTLSYEFAENIPPVLVGDPPRIQQVMINLVGNAIKFTQEGSVTISVFLPDESTWAFAVKDTGPGIPEEAQSYIFDAFRQVDGSTTRRHEGFGLGLSIVHKLTTLMKGRVKLESTAGQGSQFTVILPLATPSQEEE
ncbi:MAG: hypothetical protein GY803_15145 [Chloroflexi bacterium]|nr:hypothetical protein [Chloroflexota bacterium]